MTQVIPEKDFKFWQIEGEFLMSCNCDIFCPCVISLGKQAPTYGKCLTWWGINIHNGFAGATRLDGLIVGLMLETPGPLAEGGWTVGMYIDERSSPAQEAAILNIFAGNAGGPTGWFSIMIDRFLGWKRVPITWEEHEDGWEMSIPKKIIGRVAKVGGADGENPTMVENTKYWVGSSVTVSTGVKSRFRDWGRNWDLSGQSAEYAPVLWRGP